MINKPGTVTGFGPEQVPVINDMFEALFSGSMAVKATSIMPTTKTVSEKELVIYDDGAGTKRIYLITGKGNLGYVNLT